MSHLRHFALLTLLLLALAGCADQPSAVGSGEDASETPIPVEPDGGIGDTPTDDTPTTDDPPIPVEPDGGTGETAASDSETAIPVEPDGGIGDGAGPPEDLEQAPDFGVSSETDSVVASPASYCWSSASSGVCADGFPMPTANPITADAQLVVTYAEGELVATAQPYEGEPTDEPPATTETQLPVAVENPGIYLVDVSGLADGTYWLSLSWTGEQGDAFTVLALTVGAS